MSTNGRVLIIDDCGVTTYFLRSHLERFGFDVRTVGTGEEGLTLAETFLPDAVVVDRKLPGMFGEEVCKRLRSHEVLKHSAVVMLTSTNNDEIRREILSMGADEFIVKPIQPDDIAGRLERAISARREVRARQSEPGSVGSAVFGVRGQVSPSLHAYLSEKSQELATSLELARGGQTLALKDRRLIESALELARTLRLTLEAAEVLPFEAVYD